MSDPRVEQATDEELRQERDTAALEAIFKWQLGKRQGDRWCLQADEAAARAIRFNNELRRRGSPLAGKDDE